VTERAEAGLLDTSVVIDLEKVPLDALPTRLAISSITLAELTAGPAAAQDVTEQARRQDRLQGVEAPTCWPGSARTPPARAAST
jgi:predicted nucleic acid-binding protein